MTSGCATSGGFEYIRPSRKDVLTLPTEMMIYKHNLQCEKQKNCAEPDATK